MVALLAKVPLIVNLILVVWALIALMLILIILLQKGRGGGIGAAFGGAGASSLLGTKTGDFLTWVTIALVVLFLGLGVVLAKYYRTGGPEGLEATPQTQNAIIPDLDDVEKQAAETAEQTADQADNAAQNAEQSVPDLDGETTEQTAD
jgi:preprotein translocase subunit SecG